MASTDLAHTTPSCSGYIVCPEFLPAVARSLARAGLPLSALAQVPTTAEKGIDPSSGAIHRKGILRDALRTSLACGDAAEKYVAEVLLQESPASRSCDAKDEPPVAADVASLKPEEMRRLLIPGAVLVAVDSRLLRAGTAGMTIMDLVGNQGLGGEAGDVLDVVVREVAYRTPAVAAASTQEDTISAPSPPLTALRVEVLRPPEITSPGEHSADCAFAWAEILCFRCASAVYVAPAFHSQLSGLLRDLEVKPAHLSARSGNSRGLLTARLVALARHHRQDSDSTDSRQTTAALCLAAASASSPMLCEETQGTPLLLIRSRDEIPHGSLVAGVAVDREVGPGLLVSPGDAPLFKSHHTLLIPRRRVPRGRQPPVLPAEGALLACLLLRRGASDLGPPEEPVPSLIDSECAELENVLALQVGVKIVDLIVRNGRAECARMCRSLTEACGSSLYVDMSADGVNVRVTGVPSEVESARELVESLSGKSIAIPDRLAWRIIGKGGAGIRQLEHDVQEFGPLWIRVQNSEKPFTLDIFGEASAAERAEALVRTRHAYASMEIQKDSVARILGKGGATKREIEASSGDACLYIETSCDPCVVEVVGEAPAVERAMASLRERLLPAVRIEMPRRVVPHVIGRKGANLRELEAESGASFQVVSDVEPCFVELSGTLAATTKARQLMEKLIDQHSYDSFEVPHVIALYITSRRGSALREVESSTGASARVDLRRDPRLVEVFGEKASVVAAMEALRLRASASRRRIAMPRHALNYIMAGTGTKEIEAASGAWLHVDVREAENDEAAHCAIEAVGDETQVELAEKLLYGKVEVKIVELPAFLVPRVIGRGGNVIREIQVSTGAVLHIPDKHGATCRIEVFGTPESRVAACARIEAFESNTVPQQKLRIPSSRSHSNQPAPAPAVSTGTASTDIPAPGLSDESQVPSDMEMQIAPIEHSGNSHGLNAQELSELGLAPWLACPPGVPAEPAHPSAALGIHASSPKLLRDIQIPDRLTAEDDRSAWAGRMPIALNSPPPSSATATETRSLGTATEVKPLPPAQAPAQMQMPTRPAVCSAAQHASGQTVAAYALPGREEENGARSGADCGETTRSPKRARHCSDSPPLLRTPPASPALQKRVPTSVQPASQRPRWSLSRLSRGLSRQQQLRRGPVRRLSRRRPQSSPRSAARGRHSCSSGPSPSRGRLSTGAPDAPSIEELLKADIEQNCSTNVPPAPGPQPCKPLHEMTAALPVAPVPEPLPAQAHSAASSSGAAAPNASAAKEESLVRPSSLFAASTPAWATALPTPTRCAPKRPRLEEPLVESTTARNVRRKPTMGLPSLFILDGLNILKSRNTPTWGGGSPGDPDLEWDQLERACRFYTCRGQQVSVYLPPLRSGHEDRLERCRREFGDIFVSCRSASDDRFMINTVKLYEDNASQQGTEASLRESVCRIVTNDRFEDWKRRGDVDDAWVEHYCVRFAFGPAGFVPSELI